MTDIKNKIDMLWDDDPIDVTAEANMIFLKDLIVVQLH